MGVEDIKEELAKRTESSGDLDYIQLREHTEIITRVVSIVLGVLLVAILIIVPLIITLEIMYICFPIIRGKMEEIIEKVEDKGFLNKMAGFTLRDAKEAVLRANTVQIGEKSALWIYLGLKCKSLMVLMFIVALVIMGSSTIINFVWKLIDGLVSLVT